MIVSYTKPTPIKFDCIVSTNISTSLRNDLLQKNFYNFDDIDEDDEDDENHDHNLEQVKQYYRDQYERHSQNKNSSSKKEKIAIRSKKPQRLNDSDDDQTDDEDYSTEPELKRSKRKAAREIITYEWLKNDNSFLYINNSNEFVTHDEYTLFPNGTIKFLSSNNTMGIYRCKVKYTYVATKSFEIGPALSTSTKIEFACKFINHLSSTVCLSSRVARKIFGWL